MTHDIEMPPQGTPKSWESFFVSEAHKTIMEEISWATFCPGLGKQMLEVQIFWQFLKASK